MTRKWVPVVAACLSTAFLGGLAFGTLVTSLVFVGPLVGLGVYLAANRRHFDPLDGGWSPVAAARPQALQRGSERAVAKALGRVESRELAVSPWFGVGLGFLFIIYVALGLVWGGDNGDVWRETLGLSSWFAHPLAGMVIVASHRAMTRPIRDGTAELFASCPTPQRARALAILSTAVVPVAAFTVFLTIYGFTVYIHRPGPHGPVSLEDFSIVLAGPILVVGAVCLGSALGAWARSALVPVVAVVVVGFISVRVATVGNPGWNQWSPLSTLGPQDHSPLFQSLRSPVWYLTWLVALGVVVAIVGLLRFNSDQPLPLVGSGALAVAVFAGLLATRPIDGTEARLLADKIVRPEAHQTCDATTGARVEVCTYEGYDEFRRRVLAAVTPVGKALPPGVPAVVVRQAFDGTRVDLPPPARPFLIGGVPLTPDGEIRVSFRANNEALLEYRLRVAFNALGLPLKSHAGARTLATPVAGQARGVVALWLAGRGLSAGPARRLASAPASGDAFDRGLAWPGMCGPIVWSAQDLAAARATMLLPEARVARVVEEDFVRWSNPSTGTDTLLVALGLPPGGPYDTVVTRVEHFC